MPWRLSSFPYKPGESVRKFSLPISFEWMMLISPHSRKLLPLVQILRGWLPVVEVYVRDLPCFSKPEKNALWCRNYCIFSWRRDNAIALVLCDYHYTNNMELLIVWHFPFPHSVCPQSLLVPGFPWRSSLIGWRKWWLQNSWPLRLLPSRLLLSMNLGACVLFR